MSAKNWIVIPKKKNIKNKNTKDRISGIINERLPLGEMCYLLTDYYNSGTCDYIFKAGMSYHTLTIIRVISYFGGRKMWDTFTRDILFQRQYRLKKNKGYR